MARSFPSCPHAASPVAVCVAPSVSSWLASSSRHRPLAEATVLELSRRIQRWQRHPGGPEAAPAGLRRRALRARDHLVRHNLRLIAHTWGRHRSALSPGDEGTADAFQEAALSLVKAAEKFDPARGYRFSTYASFWVRRGFWQYASRQRRMIRLPHDKADLLQRAQRLLQEQQAATGRTPSLAWVALRCGNRGGSVDPAELERLLRIWRQTHPMELDRPCGGDALEPGAPLLERLAAPAQGQPIAVESAGEAVDLPDGDALTSSWAADGGDPQRALLPLLLQRLDPLSRRLLWHRYLREHPLTRRQIEKVMGLEPAEQERLESEALELLRQAAREYGAL